MLPLRVLLAAVLLFLVAAVPASADDASVRKAWDSQDPAFRELGRSVRRELARWERRGYTRDAKLLRLQRRGETLAGRVIAALNAEQASSPTGAEARSWAIRSASTLTEVTRATRSLIRAERRGGSPRARRLERRKDALVRQGRRETRRGLELFAQLGL